jgi:hypothetical protein
MKIVEVTWVDIEELAGGWHDLDEVEEHVGNVEGRTVKMVGYLLEEDEDKITLTDSKMGSNFYGTVNVIPRGCIVSMVVIQ